MQDVCQVSSVTACFNPGINPEISLNQSRNPWIAKSGPGLHSLLGTSLLWRSTVAFTYLKVKSANTSVFVYFRGSWSCYFGLGLKSCFRHWSWWLWPAPCLGSRSTRSCEGWDGSVQSLQGARPQTSGECFASAYPLWNWSSPKSETKVLLNGRLYFLFYWIRRQTYDNGTRKPFHWWWYGKYSILSNTKYNGTYNDSVIAFAK